MCGRIVDALADLVLPRTCAGCGVPGAMLCGRCAGMLTRPHVATPRRFPEGFPPTVAAGSYTGPVRPAVVAFKERGRAELARPLGAALALAVAVVTRGVPDASGPLRLVPVPSSRAALRSRGRDHVRELARCAVAELRAAGVPADEVRLLQRCGALQDSAGLSTAERRANLAGTFALAERAPAAPAGLLLLVDDVVTSGATLTEAAAVLAPTLVPGAPPVLAAVVAATPRASVRPATWALSEPSLDRLSGRVRRD